MGLPSQDDLLARKATEDAEAARLHRRADEEARGVAESCERYWALLSEFIARARGLGLEPRTHEPPSHRGTASGIEWVEGYRLRSGSIVTAPPLRYAVKERRHVYRPRTELRQVEELSLLIASTDAGLATGLSEPKTASSGQWPPIYRWDRAANVLLALEAELEASLLELMHAQDRQAATG